MLLIDVNADIKLEIDVNKSSSFNCIKVSTDNSFFYPSVFGGISVVTDKGAIYHPWSEGVKFFLVSSSDVNSEWIMYKENEFYYHYFVKIKKSGNSAEVNLRDAGVILNNDTLNYEYAEVYAVYLDRSENSNNPHIIGVPYLTTFNILLSNNVFVSMYFDWYKTNASQLIPYNYVYTKSSVYYSQFALYNKLTNNKRNRLDETVILKVSENIDDVFPEIMNPVSNYYEESSKRIVFDDWLPFNKSYSALKELKSVGVNNIWHILHDWQNGGYDVSLPDTYPANERYGGNDELKKISNFNKENNNLFALHENYIDIFKTSTKFAGKNLALNSASEYVFNWFNPNNSDSSFLVKPGKVISIMTPYSELIHKEFGTTSTYHDVSSSYDPSKFVDYDHNTQNAGKFLQPYNSSIRIADMLRNIHNGPVSGEGLAHFLFAGHYDDFSAQIHTGKSLPGAYYGQTEKFGGFYKPLMVNFDLKEMKPKTFVHGIGFYERFFYNTNYWQYMGKGRDSALMYAATEIAYGHGAFFSSHSYNLIEQSGIEFNFVYPLQLKYKDAYVRNILYHDPSDNRLYTASDYIRKYPDTFDSFDNKNFMSQLYVEYDNNLIIYVNRHPKYKWFIDLGEVYGYYNYHASKFDSDSLFLGMSKGGKFILPESSGWLSYLPSKQ
ncbi:MAG TPA: DUF5696 domain-containing protein [Ignavibacteria bacterium]|nr:DUF5696 domain-containing protein [Ignavibacteria bacterium]